jgi:hypothetical protein
MGIVHVFYFFCSATIRLSVSRRCCASAAEAANKVFANSGDFLTSDT